MEMFRVHCQIEKAKRRALETRESLAFYFSTVCKHTCTSSASVSSSRRIIQLCILSIYFCCLLHTQVAVSPLQVQRRTKGIQSHRAAVWWASRLCADTIHRHTHSQDIFEKKFKFFIFKKSNSGIPPSVTN